MESTRSMLKCQQIFVIEGQRAQIGNLRYFPLKEKFPSAFWVIAEKSLGNLNAIFKKTYLKTIKTVTSLGMKAKVYEIFKDTWPHYLHL